MHCAHGEELAWAQPFYANGHVAELSNGHKLPIVWSINCATGWFDNETDENDFNDGWVNFREAWERNPDGGAIGIIASTRQTYPSFNYPLLWGMRDAIWPDVDPDYPPGPWHYQPTFEMGQVLNYGKLYYDFHKELYSSAIMAFEMYHWFGDPTMEIWTDVPKEFTVTHESTLQEGTTFKSGGLASRCRGRQPRMGSIPHRQRRRY